MRIAFAAFFFATAISGAGASSVITIGDNGVVIHAPSVQVFGAADAPAVASSVVYLGAPGAAPDEIVVAPAPGSEAEKPMSIPLMPTIIRAGVEGAAFERAFGPEELKPGIDPSAAEEPPVSKKRGASGPVAAAPAAAASAPAAAVAPSQPVAPN